MTDNISGILDTSGFDADLKKVLTGIDTLEAKMDEANGKGIRIVLDDGAITTLNAYTAAVKQQNEAIAQLSQTSQANIAVTQQLAQVESQFNGAVVDNVKSLAEQRLELSYVDAQLKAITKDIQEGKGNMDRNNESLAMWTQRQQELKIELGATTSVLKSQIKEYNAASGSMDSMSQTLFQLKERFRSLNAEQRNSPMGKDLQKDIKTLDNEIKTLDKTIGNSQRNVGNYNDSFKVLGIEGQNVVNMFARMAIRMVAMQLVFMPVIAAFTEFVSKLDELLPGTDAFIEKQKKLQDALVQTEEGFTSVIAKIDEFRKSMDNAFGDGDAQYQAEIDRIRALGMVKGELYENELNQFNATQALRDKQISDLDNLSDKYYQLNNIFARVDKGGDLGVIRKDIGGLGLSEEDNKKYSSLLDDFLKKRKNNQDLKLYGNETITAAQAGVNNQSNKIAQQKIDEQTAFESENDRRIYAKKIELEKTLATTKESLRQTTEKEDIASVDKIVADTNAKYGAMITDLIKQRDLYIKSVSKEKDYVDENVRSYNNLIGILKEIRTQEKLNQEYELAGSQYSANSAASANNSSSKAGASKFNSVFGVPDYNQSAKSIDDETAAKKEALNNQFRQLASTITDSSILEQAQKLQDEKLLQVDKQAYQERLKLAASYFQTIADKINTETASLTSENTRRHFNNLTSILKGGGNEVNRDHQSFLEEQINNKAQANIDLQGVNNKIPAAQEAYNKSLQAASGPLSPDFKAEADKQVAINKETLDTLYAQQAEYEHKIAESDDAILKKKIENEQAIKDAIVNLVKETASAVKEINDNRFAAEQQQIQIRQQQLELKSRQEMRAIDATTGFAIQKDNEKAKVAAQTTAAENELQAKSNALAIKKAKSDKQYAEMQVIISTASAIMHAFEEFPYPVAIPIAAILAATGAAQYAAAASAPLPQFEKGGITSTEYFRAGERGSELMRTPSGQVSMADKDAIYKAPIGTEIFNATDTGKIIEYYKNNIAYSMATNTADAKRYEMEKDQRNLNYIADRIVKNASDNNEELILAIMRGKQPIVNKIEVIGGNENRIYNRRK